MKDYARKSAQPKAQAESTGVGLLAIMTLATVLFVGYSAYHFLHGKIGVVKENVAATTHAITHHIKKRLTEHAAIKPVEKKTEKIRRVEKKLPAKKEVAIALNPVDTQPKYDFYKLLPAMKVMIPDENITTSKPSSLPAPANT